MTAPLHAVGLGPHAVTVEEWPRVRANRDLAETPEQVASTTKTLASNAAHLARLLRAENYPPS